MSYNEKREFETIDEEILKLETDISDYEEKIVKYATDFVKLNEVIKAKEEAEKMLEHKMERWVYLNELNDLVNRKK